MCVNCLRNDVLGTVGLGRKRSIGRCDGSTSLTLDIVLFLFAESSICICLTHFLIQFAKILHFSDTEYFCTVA